MSTPNNATTNAVNDPFDPAALRLNPGGTASVGVKKLLTTIPVRKPSKQVFVRAHPSEDYRLTTAVIDLKEEGEVYLVAPPLVEALAEEVTLVTIYTAVDRQGNVFLWAVKLPKDDARANAWHLSALAAAEESMKARVRVSANMGAGAYDCFKATGNLPDPEWPDLTFAEILKIAFKDRFIDDDGHPVLRKLQGRA